VRRLRRARLEAQLRERDEPQRLHQKVSNFLCAREIAEVTSQHTQVKESISLDCWH
jgi:hypothetical protein